MSKQADIDKLLRVYSGRGALRLDEVRRLMEAAYEVGKQALGSGIADQIERSCCLTSGGEPEREPGACAPDSQPCGGG